MQDVIILQRVVPHYRLSLFRQLHSELGWRVVCATDPPGGTHLHTHLNEDFIRPYPYIFPSRNNGYRCLVPLSRICRDLNPRAVIAECSMSMSSTYQLALRHLLKRPPQVIFWSHGYNTERGVYSASRRFRESCRRMVFRNADGHLCYSKAGQDFLKRRLKNQPVFLARNSLDIEAIRSLAPSPPSIRDESSFMLLCIGRLTVDKDIPMLVRVVRRLQPQIPGISLTIIGDGPDLARIRTSAGDALGKYVHLTGPIYDEELVAPYFHAAELVVFPGAVGLGVNHALAYGVPVVAFAPSPEGPAHHPEIEYVIDGVTGARVDQFGEHPLFERLLQMLTADIRPRDAFESKLAAFVNQNLTLEAMMIGFRQLNSFLESH